MFERPPESSDFSNDSPVHCDSLIGSTGSVGIGDGPLGRKLPEYVGRIRRRETPVSSDFGASLESSLLRYFREVTRHPTFDIEAEQRCARALEDAEIAHWVTLLSYMPSARVLLDVIRQKLAELYKRRSPDLPQVDELRKLSDGCGEQPTKLDVVSRNRWNQMAAELSSAIRLLDADRNWVTLARHAAYACVMGNGASRERSSEEERYVRRVQRTELRVREIRNSFVSAYLRLVLSIAFRYDRGRVPLADLIQEGNLGLLKAVNRFDRSRGYRFSTYASWWIRYFISCALDEKERMIRIPTHALRTHRRILRARGTFYARTGQNPTPEELEQALGVPQSQVDADLGWVHDASRSLNQLVGQSGNNQLVDLLPDEAFPSAVEHLTHGAWIKEVQRVLDELSPMESKIIRLRFGLDDGDELTLQQIGDRYNVSRERIRQVEKRAMEKVRDEVKCYWRHTDMR